MSINTEIARLEAAKTALAASITGKGVTVPDGTKLDGMPALVDSIQQGGGEDWQITDASRLFYKGARWDVKDKLLPHLTSITGADSMFDLLGEAAIDPSEFDFSQVTTAGRMFAGCKGLKSIADIHLPQCETTSTLFYGCTGLTTADTSNLFGAGKVVQGSSLFQGCSNLQSVKVVGNFASATYMLGACTNLVSVDFSGLNFSGDVSVDSMFSSCQKLKSVDFSAVDMAGVKSANSMFAGCSEVEEIVSLAVPKCTRLSSTFQIGTSTARKPLKRLTFQTIPGGYAVQAAFSIEYCSFARDGMVEMFSSLPDVTGAGLTASRKKITITGNPCVTDGTLTDTDKAIATDKGWTLVI